MNIIRHPAFESQFVGPRHVDVWLPPGYDETPEDRFPVLYLHDGQNMFDPALSSYGVAWEVDRAMERLLATGEARPAILVGIWNTARRTPEFLPAKPFEALSPLARRHVLAGQGEPLGDRYLRFIVEELKPFIDARYRTLPGREDTAVMGSSRGGIISLYAICEFPGIFGAAGCVSTHWPSVEGVINPYLEEHLPEPATHRIWFDYGTHTLDALYEPVQRQVDLLMTESGYKPEENWITRKYPGTAHNEAAWQARADDIVRFLLRT